MNTIYASFNVWSPALWFQIYVVMTYTLLCGLRQELEIGCLSDINGRPIDVVTHIDSA